MKNGTPKARNLKVRSGKGTTKLISLEVNNHEGRSHVMWGGENSVLAL